jgi:hypothetical protein
MRLSSLLCFTRLHWHNRCIELYELQSTSQYYSQQHIQHNRFLECANRHRRLLSSRWSVPRYYDLWLMGLVVSRQGRVFAFCTRRHMHIHLERSQIILPRQRTHLLHTMPLQEDSTMSQLKPRSEATIRTDFIHVQALCIKQDGIL